MPRRLRDAAAGAARRPSCGRPTASSDRPSEPRRCARRSAAPGGEKITDRLVSIAIPTRARSARASSSSRPSSATSCSSPSSREHPPRRPRPDPARLHRIGSPNESELLPATGGRLGRSGCDRASSRSTAASNRPGRQHSARRPNDCSSPAAAPRLPQDQPPPGQVPRRRRRPHQPPQTPLRPAPQPPQRPPRRPHLGRLGDPRLQPRHPGHPNRLTPSPALPPRGAPPNGRAPTERGRCSFSARPVLSGASS